MSYQFGVGTLKLMKNLEITGVTASQGSSGAPCQGVQVNLGLVMIDGITCVVSAQSASLTLGADTNTGSGLLVYAYLAAGNSSTASIGFLSAGHPGNTSLAHLGTAIAPLWKFSAGTGANDVTGFVKFSGGSATKDIGKVQNVSINISYETAQLRGGRDIFPVDSKFFNGEVAGSFEFADNTAEQLMLLGGIYTSAGAASGTWSLSGTSRPEPQSLVFQSTTNAITATYRVLKAYVSQASQDFSRTDYMSPSYTYITQANVRGTTLSVDN